jgi:hypothetical protein
MTNPNREAASYQPIMGTLAHSVITYFRRLPDEELSAADIALKFGGTPSNAKVALKNAVSLDILKRADSIYSAGPNISPAEPARQLQHAQDQTAIDTSPITDAQLAMLKRFGPVSRDLQFFCRADSASQRMNAWLARQHLAALVAAGMVREQDGYYLLTDSGRGYVDDQAKAIRPARLCNSSSPGTYTGAELQYRSR